MNMKLPGPLIVQSDHTFMLEVNHPDHEECRNFLALFAEIVKSPEFIHTYRITPLSLWNAAALELSVEEIIRGIEQYSKYDVPEIVLMAIREWHGLYGKLILKRVSDPGGREHEFPGREELRIGPMTCLRLEVKDPGIRELLLHDRSLTPFWQEYDETGFLIPARERGNLKQALVRVGFPVQDLCGYIPGSRFRISLRPASSCGNEFSLYDYQNEAVDAFYRSGRDTGGSGIIVLPCGSGKTVIALAIMARISNFTLIIATNNVAVHQWRDEILAKTDMDPRDIGEFTGLTKEIKPVTITTYQMMTYRRTRNDAFENLEIFFHHNWGFIIYDEVHLLPAPVFRVTADIQAKRRVGLTATLVREDGKEEDVFALIGPKRYDVPWKTLENKGYIAKVLCTEYRVELSDPVKIRYAHATKRNQFRIAAENPAKTELVSQLIQNHPDGNILVIGQFIKQLEELARHLGFPIITGKTENIRREELYSDFKKGKIRVLIVSKVANFAIDLPDANVMIQVSGTFGSRQEEAQRLGRILRPKKRTSHFYTLISKGTVEQEFGINRQLYLVEQGYKYNIRYY